MRTFIPFAFFAALKAPVLASIDPPLGDIWAGARIVGTLAEPGHVSSASIGGTPCTGVTQLTSTTFECYAPDKAAGTYDFTATNAAGSSTLINGYEAWSPTVDYPAARLYQSDRGVTSATQTSRIRTGIVSNMSLPSAVLPWEADTPGFVAVDGAAMVRLNTGRILLLGGWAGPGTFPTSPDGAAGNLTNQILYSDNDCRNWSTLLDFVAEPPTSGPGARFIPGHTTCVCLHTVNGVEYVYWIGSDANAASRGGDVWRAKSSDLSSGGDLTNAWERISTSAPTAGKSLCMVFSAFGKIWICGGQTDLSDPATALNTVGSSSDDGVTWNAEPDAPWLPRGMVYGLPEIGGKIYLCCGGTYAPVDRDYYDDIWDFDGTTWTEVLAMGHGQFDPRQYHMVVPYKTGMAIINGWAANPATPPPGDLGMNLYQMVVSDGADFTTWVQYEGAASLINDRPPLMWFATHAMGAVVSTDGKGVLSSQGIENESMYFGEQITGTLVSAWNDQGSGGKTLSQTDDSKKPLLVENEFGIMPGVALSIGQYLELAAIDTNFAGGVMELWQGFKSFNSSAQNANNVPPQTSMISDTQASIYNSQGLTADRAAYVDLTAGAKYTHRGVGLNRNDSMLLGLEAANFSCMFFIDQEQLGSNNTQSRFDAVNSGWSALGAAFVGYASGTDTPNYGEVMYGFALVLKLGAATNATFRTKLSQWAKKWRTKTHVTENYTASGLTQFTPPARCTQIAAEVWGAGGSGGDSGGGNGGGGGGGGGYARIPWLNVVPGTDIDVYVGAGVLGADGEGSYIGSTTTVFAAGGKKGDDGTVGGQGAGGIGGAFADCIGFFKQYGADGGGSGGALANGGGGGGGSGDFNTGAAGNSDSTAGSGGSDLGGAGGTGANGAVAATAATQCGGGGGGASTLAAKTAGATGRARISYFLDYE